MKIRTIIAANAPPLPTRWPALPTPMIAKRKPSRRTSRRPFPISLASQVTDRRGSRLRARRGLRAPHPREVGFKTALRTPDAGARVE
jgi:hypothetical protein